MRRLELSPGEKALVRCLSIAAVLILALLGCWAFRKCRTNRNRDVPEPEEKELPVEMIHDESTQDSKEDAEDVDMEVALTESKSSEASYDMSISMCRSGTMNSLDVHQCASVTCDLCRKNQEPNFLGVKKLRPGTEGRIRFLPDRWWENPLALNKRPDVMQTIVSMSKSDGSWEGEEETLSGDASTFVLEDGVVRD